MDYLVGLEAFSAVAEMGTVTGAAKRLGLPKSTVSRRVAALEDTLQVALLIRKAKRVLLTDAGKELHARAAPALLELEDAKRMLTSSSQEAAGVLRITTLPSLGTTRVFTELIAEYRRKNPNVRLVVQLSYRLVDLFAEGFDIALRQMTGEGNLSSYDGLMVRELMSVRMSAYASPAFLSAHEEPYHPGQLPEYPFVAQPIPGAASGLTFEHETTRQKVQVVFERPVAETNNGSLVLALVRSGMGIGVVPRVLAEPWVQEGTLTPVLRDWFVTPGNLTLMWPTSRHMAPRVRSFIDLSVRVFQGM